jgi:hypothetical protein
MKTIYAIMLLTTILLLPQLNPLHASQGPVACGCYCGAVLPPPCSDAACKRACGWTEPRQSPPPSTEPPYDPVAERHRQAEEINREGVTYYNQGNWATAAERFREALAKWPENATFKKNLENAEEALRNKQQDDARKRLQNKLDAGFQDDIRKRLQSSMDNQQQEDMRRRLQDNLDKQREADAKGDTSNPQIREIMKGLSKINVPSSIPAEKASVGFRLTNLGDKESEDVLLGRVEKGVAAFEMVGLLAGKAIPATKAILVTGNVFIAMENGADVYLVRQNKIYEAALGYLKNKETAPAFTRIVAAMRNNKPLPDNALPEMVTAASAMLDSRLGNGSTRIAWGAMWSPDARRAGLTKAFIEIGGELIGHGVHGIVADLTVARDPAFSYASASLSRARAALEGATDPADRAALGKVIAEANRLIAESYKATAPLAYGAGEGISIFSKHVAEEGRK